MSFCVIFEDICTFVKNCPLSFFFSCAISIVFGMNTKLFLMVTLQLFKTTTFFSTGAPESFFFRFRGTGSSTFCCKVCWTEPITRSDCAMDATCSQRQHKVNNNNKNQWVSIYHEWLSTCVFSLFSLETHLHFPQKSPVYTHTRKKSLNV